MAGCLGRREDEGGYLEEEQSRADGEVDGNSLDQDRCETASNRERVDRTVDIRVCSCNSHDQPIFARILSSSHVE